MLSLFSSSREQWFKKAEVTLNKCCFFREMTIFLELLEEGIALVSDFERVKYGF